MGKPIARSHSVDKMWLCVPEPQSSVYLRPVFTEHTNHLESLLVHHCTILNQFIFDGLHGTCICCNDLTLNTMPMQELLFTFVDV